MAHCMKAGPIARLASLVFLALNVQSFAAVSSSEKGTCSDEDATRGFLGKLATKFKDYHSGHATSVPDSFVDKDGFRLGHWARLIRDLHDGLSSPVTILQSEDHKFKTSSNDGPSSPASILQSEDHMSKSSGKSYDGSRNPADSGDGNSMAIDDNEGDEGRRKINMAAFIRTAEDETVLDVRSTFLTGHSQKELLVAMLGAVRALSPAAIRLAASEPSGPGAERTCISASDEDVRKLLLKFRAACLYTDMLPRFVSDTLLQGKPATAVLPDFPLGCGPRCARRWEEEFKVAREDFNSRGKVVRSGDADGMFSRICGPVLGAVLESCGQRPNVSAADVAIDFARAGDVSTVRKILHHGYSTVLNIDLGEEGVAPPVTVLARLGHVEEVTSISACLRSTSRALGKVNSKRLRV